MDIAVPLTLETVRLVVQTYPQNFDPTPEALYNLFYKEFSYMYIYVFSNGGYFFANESDLADRQYVPVTAEEIRKELFIRSLET